MGRGLLSRHSSATRLISTPSWVLNCPRRREYRIRNAPYAQHEFLVTAASQTAVATFGAEGFEAAALTDIPVPTAAPAPAPSPHVLTVRFARPFAFVARGKRDALVSRLGRSARRLTFAERVGSRGLSCEHRKRTRSQSASSAPFARNGLTARSQPPSARASAARLRRVLKRPRRRR